MLRSNYIIFLLLDIRCA